LVIGKLSDHVSRKLILAFATTCYLTALALSWLVKLKPTVWQCYVAAALMGLGSSLLRCAELFCRA
jgi:MFS family permease